MRSPAKNGGRAAGNSIFQNSWKRFAVKARASRTMSGSIARTAPSTLIITGKNTISTATRIFGVMV